MDFANKRAFGKKGYKGKRKWYKLGYKRPVRRPSKWWSEWHLSKLAKGLEFPDSSKNLDTLKLCYYNFYNLYFAGQFPAAGWSVHQIIFPVITGLWKEWKRSKSDCNSSYFFANRVSGKAFYELGPVSECFATLPEINASDGECQDHVSEVGTFKRAVKRVLESWDMSYPRGKEIMEMKAFQNMTAMLALTLMRAMVLNKANLADSFRKAEYRADLHTLTKWRWQNGYAPPHKICIACCSRYLVKSNCHTRNMFIKILFHWRGMWRARHINFAMQRIIEKGLLACSKFYGMNLVTLTLSALEAIGTELVEICEAILNKESMETWFDVCSFLKRYISQKMCGDTVYWARLLDDNYLQEFTAEVDPYYAGVMAGIIASQSQESAFDRAEWFRKSPILAKGGFKLAQAAVRCWKRKTKDSKETI